MSTSTDVVAPRVRVWWDSGCPVCTKEITLMKRLDSKKVIDFVDLHATSAATCPRDAQEMLARLHAQEVPSGTVVSGAPAFALMWSVLPPPFRWLGTYANNSPPFMALLERSYVWFLVNVRPSIQKWAKRKADPSSH